VGCVVLGPAGWVMTLSLGPAARPTAGLAEPGPRVGGRAGSGGVDAEQVVLAAAGCWGGYWARRWGCDHTAGRAY